MAKQPDPHLTTNTLGENCYCSLPVNRIERWEHNPRKHFDEAALTELAESIRAKGVLEPLLVRPLYKTAKGAWLSIAELSPEMRCAIKPDTLRYVIVAGERRWRAAKLAGLAEVPCRILELSDRDALEVAVIENDQREDVSPLEKADGFAALVEQHQVTVEDLAQKTGRSVSTIRNLLKLRALPAIGREAVAAGLLPASTAQLIARIPDPEARKAVACQVVAGSARDEVTEKEARQVLAGGERNDEEPEPLSYRDTQELIAQHYMVELKGAPFSRKSLDLVPDAGSCDECPKRTGNHPEYADARADVCTDTACYHRKVKAHNAQLLQAAKAGGQKVLPKKECEQLFEGWNALGLRYDSPYIDLAHTCYEVRGGKTWKTLVGKQLADQVVIAVDREGGVHELAPKPAALKIVRKEHGSASRSASQSPGEAAQKKRETEERRKADLGREAALRANCRVATAVETASFNVHGWAPNAIPLLRSVVHIQIGLAWSDACKAVAKRRGLPAGPGHESEIRKLADALTSPAELLGLLAELGAARKTLDWKSPWYAGRNEDDKLFQGFGIKRGEIIKEIERERKAGSKATNGHKAVQPSTNGHAKNGKATPPPPLVTRETALTDLVDSDDTAAWDCLDAQDLVTVGDVLDKAPEVARGEGLTQKAYALLRNASGSHVLGNALGDALVDADLLGVGAKGAAPIAGSNGNGHAGGKKRGKRKEAVYGQ